MKIQKIKPITNGSRHRIKLSKYLLAKCVISDKTLKKSIKQSQGRNNSGRITSWHRGGRNKLGYKNILDSNNFYKTICLNLNYDPFRSSFVSNTFDIVKKIFQYQLSTTTNYPGSYSMKASSLNEIRCNYRTKLENIPGGSLINNISINENRESQYIKSSGSFGHLLQKNKDKAIIRLPSKKLMSVSLSSYATIGIVSNEKNNLIVLGKAGLNRHKGRRPIVRGIAMNPVDHPHGGRTNGGRPSVTPWGLPTKCKFYLKKSKIRKQKKKESL